jgi:hypothetical protein
MDRLNVRNILKRKKQKLALCAPWTGKKPHFTSSFPAPSANNAGAISTLTETSTWTSIQ